MSLFENPEYQWRETFLVFFEEGSRPKAETVQAEMQKLGKNFEITGLRANDEGDLESVTIISRDDFAAMDISCISGEEVTEQLGELVEQLESEAVMPEEQAQIKRITNCVSRFDVLHFEKHSLENMLDDENDDGFMDPGGLLIILDRLGELCKGIVVDPQSNALL